MWDSTCSVGMAGFQPGKKVSLQAAWHWIAQPTSVDNANNRLTLLLSDLKYLQTSKGTLLLLHRQ